MMSSAKELKCRTCGSTDIDIHSVSHEYVCTQCGVVNNVEYCIKSTRDVVNPGVFIGTDRRRKNFRNTDGLNPGVLSGAEKNRKIARNTAKQMIQMICAELKLKPEFVEEAFRYYTLAVGHKVAKAQSRNVIAACVYLTCRIAGTPHMLVDVCDVIKMNLYKLGRIYVKLLNKLMIYPPVTDPIIYISRFANALNFGRSSQAVADTACRVIKRMNKDWMSAGRKPSGLCGAALFIAAKMHNEERTVLDIIKVVKVCQRTVRRRIVEFGRTPSSLLTVDEFMAKDLKEEQDPPSFQRLQRQLEDDNKMKEIKNEVQKVQKLIEKCLESTEKRSKYSQFASMAGDSSGVLSNSDSCSINDIDSITAESTAEVLGEKSTFIDSTDENKSFDITELTPLFKKKPASIPQCTGLLDATINLEEPGPTSETTGLKYSIEDCLRSFKLADNVVNEKLDTTGMKDEELDHYFMDSMETEKKDVFWHESNKLYLKEQEERKERNAKAGLLDLDKKKCKRRDKEPTEASTAGEAIAEMLQRKNISFKLDYDAWNEVQASQLNSADYKQSSDAAEEDIEAIIKRCGRNKFPKRKPPAPIPSKIKKLMSSLVAKHRQMELLAKVPKRGRIQRREIPYCHKEDKHENNDED